MIFSPLIDIIGSQIRRHSFANNPSNKTTQTCPERWGVIFLRVM